MNIVNKFFYNEPICHITNDYVPSENEEFMSKTQLEYFRRMLLGWRASIIEESYKTIDDLKNVNLLQSEDIDRGCEENKLSFELKTRDRARKLIFKIDAALKRIQDGTYGYCEITGEPISLKRLKARPIATLSIEAQEMHEKQERTQREQNVIKHLLEESSQPERV